MSEAAKAGKVVVIVGPSGAGKDSLIGFAARQLAGRDRFRFVRRVITRPADAGSEDHEAASADDFAAAVTAGRFAVHWQANGLAYGIPRAALLTLGQGTIHVVNGSRAALPQFRDQFGTSLVIVLVTASPDILARRLAARGRESEADILARLNRNAGQADVVADTIIHNDGALEEAGQELVDLLQALAANAHQRVGTQPVATALRQG